MTGDSSFIDQVVQTLSEEMSEVAGQDIILTAKVDTTVGRGKYEVVLYRDDRLYAALVIETKGRGDSERIAGAAYLGEYENVTGEEIGGRHIPDRIGLQIGVIDGRVVRIDGYGFLKFLEDNTIVYQEIEMQQNHANRMNDRLMPRAQSLFRSVSSPVQRRHVPYEGAAPGELRRHTPGPR